jgi:hypothetical protein
MPSISFSDLLEILGREGAVHQEVVRNFSL